MLTAAQRRISSATQISKDFLDNLRQLVHSARKNYFGRFKPTYTGKKAAIVLTIDSSTPIKTATSAAEHVSPITYYAEQFTPENLDEQSTIQYRLVSNIQISPQTPTKSANKPTLRIKAETPGGTVMVSNRSAELAYSETDDRDATPSGQKHSVSRQIFFLSPEASVPDQQSEYSALEEDSQMLNDKFAARSLFDEFDSDESKETTPPTSTEQSHTNHRNSESLSITQLPIIPTKAESTRDYNPFAKPIVSCKGEPMALTKKDLEARTQIPRSSLPSQRTVMGGISATEHFNSTCKSMRKALTASPATLESPLQSHQACRKEWTHANGVRLSPKDTDPQVTKNLGCGDPWINTNMMVPEQIVYFLASNSLNSTTPFNMSYFPQMFVTADNIVSSVTYSLTAQVEINTAKAVKPKNGNCARNRTIDRSVTVTFNEMHANSAPNLASSTDTAQTVFAIISLLSANKASHTEIIHAAPEAMLFSQRQTPSQSRTTRAIPVTSCSRTGNREKLRDITNLYSQKKPLTPVTEPVKLVRQKRYR